MTSIGCFPEAMRCWRKSIRGRGFAAWPRRSLSGSRTRSGLNVRPVRRIAVRCRRKNGTFAYGVLICSLLPEQVQAVLQWTGSQTTDPIAVLLAYVTCYDQRGGGIETSLKGDKSGLGLTKRNKKRFEAQHMLVLLGTLAHNVVIWARRWLAIAEGPHCGVMRMVRDVFPISGFLSFDAFHQLVEIVLNQQSRRAHQLIIPLRELLAPLPIVINLGET